MVEIKEYYSGAKATLYVIQKSDDEFSEFENFLNSREFNDSEHRHTLVEKLMDMADNSGCQERFFKHQSNYYNAICRLKGAGDLRLYCLRYDNMIVILGSGGTKHTRTYQEDDKLYEAIKFLENISDKIDAKIINKEIFYKNNKFDGELTFEENE